MKDHPTPGATATMAPPDESMPHATEPRSAISSLVQKALVTFNERQRHRKVLINLLILAQALLVVAAAPGYIGTKPGVAALVLVLAGLFVCLLAAIFNQFGRNTTRATYVLVVGSGLAVLAQVFLAALTGTPAQAAQASLLLLTVLLEAGLFFAPILTMLLAGASIALTIVAFIISVVQAPSGSGGETYGLIVGTLGLQAVTGLVAWLLAQFVFDSVQESQRSQDAQFAQARLDAVLVQQAQRQRQAQELLTGVHEATTRALAGDMRARTGIVEGELAALARDVNLLLQHLAEAAAPAQVGDLEPGAQAPGRRSAAGEIASTSPGSVFGIAAQPTTPLANPVVTEEHVARRMHRVRELAGELAGALSHSQEGLDAAATATEETQAAVGASVALAHELLASAQQAVDRMARAHRALAATAAGTDAAAAESNAAANEIGEAGVRHESSEPVSFLGLGSDVGVAAAGLTNQFQLMPNGELAEAGSSGDLAAPEPPLVQDRAAAELASAGGGTPAPNLPELASALAALREAIASQERGASTLTHDLGLLSRQVRGIDGQVAWARQAIGAVRRSAERLNTTAGGAALLPVSAEADASAPAQGSEALSHGPITSRPLADAELSHPSIPPASGSRPGSKDGEQADADRLGDEHSDDNQ
jgi:hypothetical protein